MPLIFARFHVVLAEKQPKNIKFPPPGFTVGTVFLSITFPVKRRQSQYSQEIYSFVSSHHCTDDQNFTSYPIAYSQSIENLLFAYPVEEAASFVFEAFFLIVLCNIDLKILINGNVMVTSNLG